MKKLPLLLGAACTWLCMLAVHATPVTINNASFENQLVSIDPPAQVWTNNLEPDWKETGGPSSDQGFMERLGMTGEDGTDTLGMALGHDVWQDLAATVQPDTLYTMNVKVGNRTGATDAGNQSVFGLATTAGAFFASSTVNASTLTTVGNFAEAPALTFDTYSDPCTNGQTIRILLQARGVNRSHYDLIRLDAVASTPAGRPAATLAAASTIGSTSATLGGSVTVPGSANPSVTLYWDTADKGGTPAAWTNSLALPGTFSGAFSNGITGLAPATTYYARARISNGSGTVWAAPCISFTTTAVPPVVENVAASAVNGSSALIGANVTTSGGTAPDVTLYYGSTDGGTTPGAWASSLSIPALTGSATRTLTGLTPATTYYFRAYAQNSGGSDWADATATFTTTSVSQPAVENAAAEAITGTAASLKGNVTSTGGEVPVVTLFWGTTNGGTTPASWANSRVIGAQSGSFASLVSGLTPLTNYFFRCRAVNSVGTAWAPDTRSFTTASLLPASVIINEFHYDPIDHTKAEEFIEFYNPTAAPISMAGWTIQSAVDYTFPAGTSIAAGGYKVVVQNLAGFAASFSGAGTPLGPWVGTLKNSGEKIRLHDAAGNLVDEVDYKAGFPWPTATKGAGVSAELMHPELNNDLGGSWRPGSTPPPAVYVPFASQWRWRRGVQGDTGEPTTPFTAWRALSYVEPAVPATNAGWSTGTTPLGFGENDGIAGTTENTTLLTDMAGGTLYTSVYLRKVFTIPAGQVPSQIKITTRCDDGCIVWINGVYAGSLRPNATIGTGHHFYNTIVGNAPEPAPTEVVATVSAAAVNLVAGNNVIAIHALQSSVASSDFFIDAEVAQVVSGGVSPNGANTRLLASASAAPPAIRGVEHLPNQPAAGQAVVVTATITDPDALGSVSLTYQTVDPGSYIRKSDPAFATGWTTIPMNDAGTGGDAVAGDSVYSCTVPSSVQTHRRLVRYRITAADSLANSVTAPLPDDEQPNFAYFVYNGIPAWSGAVRPTAFNGAATPPQTFTPQLLNTIPPYQLIALDADVALCLYTGPDTTPPVPYFGTLVYDGKVYDHVTFNIRGIGSTRVSGKNKLAFKFNRARDIRVRDNWGRLFDQDWNSLSLDANASPWAAMHRGSAGVEEASTYRIFELAGMNSLRTTYAQLRIIRKAQETAAPGSSVVDATAGGTVDGQYTTDLWGLYLVLEPTEGNFIGERNLPDGNIYAIEGNGGDKKYQAANQVADGSDWITYRTGRTAASQNESWYRTNMDLPNLFNYIALSRLMGNVDVRDGDNYRYYHRSSDNRWVIMGYDHDMQFIAASHWTSQALVDGVMSAGVPHSYAAIMRIPSIALEYRNRCREFLSLVADDGTPAGGQVGQLLDEYAQMVNPAGVALTWADLDAAMWNLHPRSAGGGANSGQTSHKGNFFRATFTDARGAGGGSIASNYPRTLPDPDGDGYSDHEGLIAWFRDYATNTYPPQGAGVVPWSRRPVSSPVAIGGGADTYIHRQKGFGYKYLEWESLYGGHFAATTNLAAGVAAGDLTAAGSTLYVNSGASAAALSAAAGVLYPNKPVITPSGTAGWPVNDIRLHSSNYADPQNDAISAVQWRVGEISAPGIPLYDPAAPRIYEVEELWRSAEIPTASPTGIADVRVPASALRVGHTYRARVRHKDATGRWSFWSDAVQFAAAAADLGTFRTALRVSEINYNPGPVVSAESAAPGWNALWTEQEFEFIELRNISAQPVDLTDIHFRSAVEYDFPAGFSLAAGASTIVCKNPAAFAIRYPAAVASLAPGSFGTTNLSNSGESIELKYGLGDDLTSDILKFSYNDKNGWPTTPDGLGTTLVLRDPVHATLAQQFGRNVTTLALNPGSHEDPAEWRASYTANGNPGGGDRMTYALWAAGNAGRTNPAEDTDFDGLDNRLEYALSGDTGSSSTHRAPDASFSEVSGLDYATLTYTRRSEADDVAFTVQFSDQLLNWNIPATLVTSTENNDGTRTETWRSVDPVSTKDRIFGRVKVATTP